MRLGTPFQVNQIVYTFWTEFLQKNYFGSRKEKVNITIEIQRIQFRVGTKFQLKQTILITWTKFAKNDISGLKEEKNEHHYQFNYST